jgi:hypothetical protein
MLSLVVLLSSLIMISSLFAESGPRIQGGRFTLLKLPQAIGGSGLYDIMVGFMAIFIASSLMGSLNI